MKSLSLFFFAIFFSADAVAQTLGSCQIFPSDNPWNVRVDSLPVDSAHSAAYIANVGVNVTVHPDFGSDTDYGIPWEAVNASQPFVSINTSNGYQDQSDPGPMPIPLNPVIEHDDDSHVLIVDTSNHHLYELYQAVRDINDDGWAATSSAIFALDSNNYRPDSWTSCDAAGLPIFPGLVRLDECKAGAINHALRFTIEHTQQAWIFPARHHAGPQTDTNHMPMGARLRLKASFNDSNYTGYAKVIITALKKYGIILADNGSNWYISGEWNPNWPDDDISQLKKITGNDFEVVNTGYPIETESKEYPTPVIPIPGSSSVDATKPESFNFTVYPNPSSGMVTFSASGIFEPCQIEITDQIGRSILKQTVQSGSSALDLTGLPNGCYFLHAETPQGEASKLIEVLH